MTRKCSQPGCKNRSEKRGFCSGHYQRWRSGKEMESPLRLVAAPLLERMKQYIEYDTNGGCWLWAGSIHESGYGLIGVNNRSRRVHREMWRIFRGPIPRGSGYHGTCVLHRCDIPACCNPDHLFLGTQADNMRDMRAKGRWSRGDRPKFDRRTYQREYMRKRRAAQKSLRLCHAD